MYIKNLIILFAVIMFIITCGDAKENHKIPVKSHMMNPVIINIDNKTIEKIGKLPFKRKNFGDLIEVLNNCNTKGIFLNINFVKQKKEDEYFLNIIKKNQHNIYFPIQIYVKKKINTWKQSEEYLYYKKFQLPNNIDNKYFTDFNHIIFPHLAFLRSSKSVGPAYFIYKNINNYRVVDKAPLLIKVKGKLYPSLYLLIVADYLNVDITKLKIKLGKYIKLPNCQSIPIDEFGQMKIIFNEIKNYYKKYSFIDIINNHFNKKELKDRIVIVGRSYDTKIEHDLSYINWFDYSAKKNDDLYLKKAHNEIIASILDTITLHCRIGKKLNKNIFKD